MQDFASIFRHKGQQFLLLKEADSNDDGTSELSLTANTELGRISCFVTLKTEELRDEEFEAIATLPFKQHQVAEWLLGEVNKMAEPKDDTEAPPSPSDD